MSHRERFRSFALPFVWLAALMAAAACGDDDVDGTENAEVVSCEGSCSCDVETNTCSCQGGTTCVTECNGPCTLACDGNARCDMECGADCTVECVGTTGCDAEVGPGSDGICNGTGDCSFTCNGDCTFDCPGTSQCVVFCSDVEGADCAITSCPMVTECEGNILACRTECPTPPDPM